MTVLVDLLASPERAAELRARAVGWQSWTLTPPQLCDLELLVTGAFAPLTGFQGRADVDAVCATMRLAGGAIWPIPITLDVPTPAWRSTSSRANRSRCAIPKACCSPPLQVEDVWRIDRAAEAQAVYGTVDPRHPGVAQPCSRSSRPGRLADRSTASNCRGTTTSAR